MNRERFYFFLLLVACMAFTVPLAAHAYNGIFMRYNGEDYCHGAIVVHQGFWRANVYSYLHVSTYNGNRYSLGLFSFIGDAFGPKASSVYPLLAILLWVVGLYALFRAGCRLLPVALSRLEALLAAEVTVFAILSLAPDVTQSLYWRSGMLTYTAPLIVNAFLLAWVLREIRQQRLAGWALGGLFFLAVVAGGFSETSALLQTGYLALLLVGVWLWQRRADEVSRRSFLPVFVALAGTAVALILLAVSPTNQERLAHMPSRPSLMTALQITWQSTYIFFFIVRKYHALPMFLEGLFFACLSLIVYIQQSTTRHLVLEGQETIWRKMVSSPVISLRWWQWLLVWGGVSVSTIFLVMCTMLPSAYVQQSYPGVRALFTVWFVAVFSVAVAGFVAGQLLGQMVSRFNFQPTRLMLVGMVLIALLALLPISTTPPIFAETAKIRKWTVLWEQRDQQIRQARQQGITEIEVMKLDHVIGDVGELSDDPNYWYNNCAEWYYQMKEIKANQPGWDQ